MIRHPERGRRPRCRALILVVASSLALGGCAVAPPAANPGSGKTERSAEMAQEHHTIDYIELAAVDLAAAKEFYSKAFGWKFNEYGPTYAGIQATGGGEVGGIRQDASVVRGGPLVILYSVDLEASEKAVLDSGGTVVKGIFSFPGGRRFHFADPSGNELAVWSDR